MKASAPALALIVSGIAGLSGLACISARAEPAVPAGYASLQGFFSPSAAARREAARDLAAAGDVALLPGLVDALFFLPRDRRTEALTALRSLAAGLPAAAGVATPGERYHDWVQWVSDRPDLHAKPGYLDWKAGLLARIDSRYRAILYSGAPVRLRLEEVVSGGVGVEGIPALDQPAAVPAAAATYLEDGERVFGVSVGGEQRAYPLRILSWHEMVNDVVGGHPVSLSYCTLCGSAVLFDTARPGEPPYTFGTSGLLYRSNKLMLDRQTRSLWSNLTGEPQVGRLAGSDSADLPRPRLAVLPVTATTWRAWRDLHPATTVLALDSTTAERWGFDYRPGAAERKRQGVRFPTPAHAGAAAALDDRDEILAVRLGGAAKAYALVAVLHERVVNDHLGDLPLVVVGDPASGAARAFQRRDHSFQPSSGGPDTLIDESGRAWQVTEEALVLSKATAPSANENLARLPAHLAYWFGWYAFFPNSELYVGREARPTSQQEVKR